MLLRRLLGGALLSALVAPALLAALPGASRTAAFRAPGGDCCVVAPCCASGGACATGGCEKPKAAAAAATSAPAEDTTPRLAAGCADPTPATPVAGDRDPMIPAARATTPAPRPRVSVAPSVAWSASEREDDPTVPPPRA